MLLYSFRQLPKLDVAGSSPVARSINETRWKRTKWSLKR